MKRIIIFLTLISSLMVGCNDYLDVSTDSTIEDDFVFSSIENIDKAVLGAYELLRSSSGIHSGGLFYDAICVGSDIELGCELPSFGNRYNVENLWFQTPSLDDISKSSWNGMYETINRCNIILNAFEGCDDFINADKTTPSAITHLYGEIIAIRATMYYELTRSWGDILYFTEPISSKEDYANAAVTSRDTIQEKEIANLIEVEPMMYHLNGEGDVVTTAERMTKEYVEGLIARIALIRGGYSLRPVDYSGDGDVIQSHSEWGKMLRRTDWKDYYEIAKTYLEKIVNGGNASLVTTDPRTPSSKYSNPFQYYFQQMMELEISSESIYEVSMLEGTTTERPYAFGRPSDGGNTGYPPKAYGQCRFYPTYYYGMFNTKDLRRDVTVTMTAQGGSANEKMLSFKKGNKSNGGLALNKWDYSRMSDKTYAVNRRITGINAPYMRLGDMVLLLAETYAVLGDEGSAKTELLKIRERAFNPEDSDYNKLTTDYVAALSGDNLIEAIQNERAFELGGEGARRLDLVRWGIFGEKINELQTEMAAVEEGLQNNGRYEFDNGNVISSYLYTKSVTMDESGLDDILTTACDVDESDPSYPLCFPGWRGTASDWSAYAGSSTSLLNTMLAIEGAFTSVNDTKAAELINDGYSKTEWGVNLLGDGWQIGQYGIFGGYLPDCYSAGYPPRYILPIPAQTILYSNGNITNAYGFPDE